MKQKGDGESPTPTPPTHTPPRQDQSEKPNGAHCQDMGSSSAESKSDPEGLPQQRPSAVTSNLIHSHAISVALCIFVQVCMHARVGVHVNEKKKEKKVEKGLRRQQLAWELRGHGTGIDFINRLSQHSGSGCTDTECGTEMDGTNERSTSASFHFDSKIVHELQKRKRTD